MNDLMTRWKQLPVWGKRLAKFSMWILLLGLIVKLIGWGVLLVLVMLALILVGIMLYSKRQEPL